MNGLAKSESYSGSRDWIDVAYVTEEVSRVDIDERKKNQYNLNFSLELADIVHRYGKPGAGGQ